MRGISFCVTDLARLDITDIKEFPFYLNLKAKLSKQKSHFKHNRKLKK